MHHAKVDLPKPAVHATHPFKHPENHRKLLEYLQERLTVAKSARDGEINRLTRIDKKMAGWIRLREADINRAEKSEETGEPLVTRLNLPLTFIHIDDMMTFLAETFAPSRGMFYNTGTPDEVDQAEQIVTKMNNDSLYTGMYREVLQGLFSALKYNLGGFTLGWGQDTGPTFNAASTGDDRVFDQGVKWQGNRVKACDRYNLLIDPSVHPTKLHLEGEFGGYAELKSRYWVQSRAARGQFYNCESAFRAGSTMNRTTYYRHPPTEAKLESSDGRGAATDWVSILSAMPSTLQDGHELVTFFCRLNPTEFGLVPASDKTTRNRYELWRFTILDNEWIISVQWMDNVHNHLPIYLGLVHDDVMSVAQKSPAEILIPLQDFASFLLNTHQQATRSAIYGTTFYDPTMVKLDKIPKGETAARLPVESKAYGKDIRSFVWESRANIDTSGHIESLGAVMDIVNQFFPTQALPSQIASIDRAVSNQVAAVQHGANRRQQKTGRLLDDSLFRPMRFAMYYNILQYQPDGEELTDFYTGKQVKMDLASMRDTNLPFIIGQGLKAIDRMMSAQMMQQVIFALIQAPQAAQGIDLLAMIDYWTSMIDIEMDMKQFRLAPPAAVPGTDPAAAGGEAGIQPATAPEAVTEPIYS
jgi:hypothetical protein